MPLNYLKQSFRRMARNPFFTCINIAGLSVGFTAFFALWQHASYELKSDQWAWFKEERIIYADSNLFSFFAIPLVEVRQH
jgi:hypothetical protein